MTFIVPKLLFCFLQLSSVWLSSVLKNKFAYLHIDHINICSAGQAESQTAGVCDQLRGWEGGWGEVGMGLLGGEEGCGGRRNTTLSALAR